METRELLEEIYPRLDRAQAVGSLNPQDKGNYYLLTCPKCKKRGAYLYKTGVVIKCNRLNESKYSISLWDYIQETKNLSNQEAPRELARLTWSKFEETVRFEAPGVVGLLLLAAAHY